MAHYKVLEYTTDTATHQTTVFDEHTFNVDEFDKAMAFIESYVPMTNIAGIEWQVSPKPILSGMGRTIK